MLRYDPEQPPNPEDWLALDESERIRLIERYHRPAGVIRLSERVHARFHAVVENQVALADPAAVPRALQRLRQQGLTRHEALHAIGAVLGRHISVMSCCNPAARRATPGGGMRQTWRG